MRKVMSTVIKEVVKVKLSEDYKDKALSLIDETIDKVSELSGTSLENKDKRKIRNLTLDQVNVNVSHRANSKTIWVFNIENSLPIVVEREENLPKMGALVNEDEQVGSYKMKPNLTWTFNRENDSDDGINRKEFEKLVLEMLLEDIETAAFYGTLSYVGDVNEY